MLGSMNGFPPVCSGRTRREKLFLQFSFVTNCCWIRRPVTASSHSVSLHFSLCSAKCPEGCTETPGQRTETELVKEHWPAILKYFRRIPFLYSAWEGVEKCKQGLMIFVYIRLGERGMRPEYFREKLCLKVI